LFALPVSKSPPFTCVIIDDNEMSRFTLEHLVELDHSLQLVASVGDAVQALAFLEHNPPVDLLLLDIEMPALSGLDLVRMLPEPAPAIILVTSHRDFAVEAFALRVDDYLVKPVDFVRFHQAIRRVIDRRLAPPPEPPVVLPRPGSSDQHLFIKVNNRMVRLNFEEVLYIEALSTYSVLVTPTQKHIVYVTLKSLEERLPFAHFRRVHRSYIVNTHRIDVMDDNMLHLGAYQVPVGKSYQEEFYRSMRNL
jgi:DNA-binding LytR/AlgR family response regulator